MKKKEEETLSKGTVEELREMQKYAPLNEVLAVFLEYPHYSLNHNRTGVLHYGKHIDIEIHYQLTNFRLIFDNQVKTFKKEKMFKVALEWAKKYGAYEVDGYWISNNPSIGIYNLVYTFDLDKTDWPSLAEHLGELFPLIAPYFKAPIVLPEE